LRLGDGGLQLARSFKEARYRVEFVATQAKYRFGANPLQRRAHIWGKLSDQYAMKNYH
jgi:hypothetical protein